MRWIWAGAAILGLMLATAAHADTIYLKSGEAIWGREVYIEGDWVILVRPTGPERFRKDQVSRIEPARISLPRFYDPPKAAPEPAAPGPAGPGAPAGQVLSPEAREASQRDRPSGPPEAVTELPPPPPPPSPGR